MSNISHTGMAYANIIQTCFKPYPLISTDVNINQF
jgi:hypothetical protein